MVILASKCKDLRKVSIFTKWTTVLCNSVNYSNASKSKCVIYVSLHTTLRMVWEISVLSLRAGSKAGALMCAGLSDNRRVHENASNILNKIEPVPATQLCLKKQPEFTTILLSHFDNIITRATSSVVL